MSRQRNVAIDTTGLCPLTKSEIDRRLQFVAGEVAARGRGQENPDDGWKPRWIAPRDLVRRMSRFLSYN